MNYGLHKTLIYDYLWIIVMFLSAVWTLILTAPIHCRASIDETVVQWHISSNLMKKQHLVWLECEHIYNTFSFLGELLLRGSWSSIPVFEILRSRFSGMISSDRYVYVQAAQRVSCLSQDWKLIITANSTESDMIRSPALTVSCRAPRVSVQVKGHPAVNPPVLMTLQPQTRRRAARCGVREPIWFWLPPDNPGLYQRHPQHACRYQGGCVFLNLPETALVMMQYIIFSTDNCSLDKTCIWKWKR